MSERAEPLYTTLQITFFFPLRHTAKCQEAPIKKHVGVFVRIYTVTSADLYSSRATVEEMKMCCSLLHCFHYREAGVQAGIGQNYNPNSLLWPFSCLVNWDCVFEGEIWLNNMPLGGKSRDRQSNGWSLTQPRTREMNYSSIQPVVRNSSGDESS